MNFAVWEILALVGVVFIILEVLTTTFYFIPIGIAFLITALIATEYSSWVVLSGVFALSAIVNFIIFRRTLSKFHQKAQTLTNFEGMVGQECEVIEAIDGQHAGYVKLYGDNWKAFGYQNKSFKVGDLVQIVKVAGNKVTVDSIN